MLRPVRQLVQQGGVVALRIPEGLERRQLDPVGTGRVVRYVAAVVYFRPRRCDIAARS